MSESTENTNESNPFTKPGFIIAAILVLALIAGAVVIFLLPKGGNTADPAPAPAGTTAAAKPSASSVEESTCGLPSSKDTALGTAPATTWELVGKMAAPTDPETSGPGITDDDGFRSCFSNSPTGALYAAANVIALASSGDKTVNLKTTENLLVPGPGRDLAIADSKAMPATAPPSSATVQFKGFIIKSYSPTSANVDLAFQSDKGLFGHTVLPLKWKDGDWKVEVSDSGDLINDITQISDLSSFITWSGV